jgi:hypothetical protein
MINKHYDLIVIGGGSGGFGTAFAATKRGLRVLLVEQGPMLGGTSTMGGVNTWEPGIGGPVMALELYEHLSKFPHSIGISRTVKYWTGDQPWGLSRIDSTLTYADTTRRAGFGADRWFRVTFEPYLMAIAMNELLTATGKADIRLNTRCVEAEKIGNRISSIIIIDKHGKEQRVTANYFADATGQIILCKTLGCKTYLGVEPTSLYNEPSAPEQHHDQLNGVTVSFRVKPVDYPSIEPLPAGVPDETRTGTCSITEYPNGDLNMNSLPLMEGWEYHSLGEKEGRRICEERLYQLWHWLQCEKGFDQYKIKEIFPLTGVREGSRLIGRKVLTENDVRLGYSNVTDKSRWIALADHALDVHGEGHLCRELNEPYGVPYECLLPQEYTNLIIPCRGASFSHIAAASCRLSRTMMQLGNAAGIAVATAATSGSELPDVDLARVRGEMQVELTA